MSEYQAKFNRISALNAFYLKNLRELQTIAGKNPTPGVIITDGVGGDEMGFQENCTKLTIESMSQLFGCFLGMTGGDIVEAEQLMKPIVLLMFSNMIECYKGIHDHYLETVENIRKQRDDSNNLEKGG